MIKESVKAQLEKIVGKDNVLVAPEALKAYSYDGTSSWIHEPDVVVFPISTEQISEIMKLANTEKIPVTPRGGGTNVSGGSVPIMGGIVLVTTKMNNILRIDKENLTATVEPGVVLQDLTMRLAKEGLFFPPDPQSFLGATLGGIIAENAGKNGEVIAEEVRKGTKNFGYNASKDKFEDLVEAGIIDPTKVTRCALQNAASISAMFLTTECVIADEPEDNKHDHGAPQMPNMGGMGGMY